MYTARTVLYVFYRAVRAAAIGRSVRNRDQICALLFLAKAVTSPRASHPRLHILYRPEVADTLLFTTYGRANSLCRREAQHSQSCCWSSRRWPGSDGKLGKWTIMLELTGDQNSINGNAFVKNYEFDFDFGPPWGNCGVTMTSVLGHLTGLEFPLEYKDWRHPPPARLFDAPIQVYIADVGVSVPCFSHPLTRIIE